MRTFRGMAWAGQVWLAAALMLFPGVPHFVCRCPDGHVKSLCFGPAGGSGCCCGDAGCCATRSGGGCCGAGAPSHPLAPCCAAVHGPQHREAAPAGGGCTRSLAPGNEYVPATGKIPGPDLTAATVLPPPTSATNGPLVAGGWSPGRAAHSLSPPPDLITLLQHFLI